jgi:hypothetical protein
MLQSMVNAELPEGPLSALNEFIDNALGAGSGNANNVMVAYKPDVLMIEDDGDGIEDINTMFRIGDSLNRLHNEDIGNFGWGSKVGALYLGWHVQIETVRDGKYHSFAVDWQKVRDEGEWPYEYQGKGRKPRGRDLRKGTRILIGHRHQGRSFVTRSMADRLAHIYSPALRAGKRVLLAHYTRAMKEQYRIDLADHLDRNVLTDETRMRVEVNGKGASIRAGAMEKRTGRLNGLHIGFGHRVIHTVKSFNDRPMPVSLYAQVSLDKEWKKSLSATKNDLAFDKAELIDAVEEALAGLLDKMANEAQEARMDIITAQLEQAGADLFADLNDNPGVFVDAGETRRKSGMQGGPKEKNPTDGPNESNATEGKVDENGTNDADEATRAAPTFGFTFKLDNLGNEVFKVDYFDTRIEVALNKDVPYLEKAFAAPIQDSAIWAMISNALMHWLFGPDAAPDALKRLFPAVHRQFERWSFSTEERKHYVLREFLDRAPTLREPSKTEIEEAFNAKH